MASISGRRPRVTHNAIVKAQFYLATKLGNKRATLITMSDRVTPDSTFPKYLILGQTMFHALGLQFQNIGSIQLLKLLHKLILHPVQLNKEINHSFILTTISPISRQKLTRLEDIRRGDYYATKNPSLFGKNKQKN